MKQPDAILFYEGKWYMFSNFSAFAVDYRGHRYMTAEHAYQAAKFASAEQQALVQDAPSAHMAKQVARAMVEFARPDWQGKKLLVMEEIIRLKHYQHEIVQQRLCASGNREIIEDSPTDNFWGRGPDWQGENHLGRIWMKLRAEASHERTACV